MKRLLIIGLCGMTFLSLIGLNIDCYAQVPDHQMRLYLFTGMMDSVVGRFADQNGIGTVKLVGQADIDPENDLVLNEDLLKARILKLFPGKYDKGIGVLDWEGEGAKVLLRPRSSSQYQKVMNEFIKAVRFAKAIRPGVKWGFYGLPFRNFWAMNAAWQANCEKLKPLLSECDIIFPSVYILYSDKQVQDNANSNYIKNNVEMALKLGSEIGKPVMPFVWHRLPGLQMIPNNKFQDYVKDIISASYDGDRVSGIVWWGAPLYYYRVKSPAILKEANNEKSFMKYHDSVVIQYSRGILKQISNK